MPKLNRITFARLAITGALCAATFGSFRLAQAMTQAQSTPSALMHLPVELGTWMISKDTDDLTQTDVIIRHYLSPQGTRAVVVIRKNAANAVLHDLNSCLISAQAKSEVLSDLEIKSFDGVVHEALLKINLPNESEKLFVTWFQAGKQTAANRWGWRLLCTTSSEAREAPAVYQSEVFVTRTADQQADIKNLRNLSYQVYQELVHANY